MNTVALIGRLTRDPELRSMNGSDRSVCDLRIAVDNGSHDSTFIDVATFDKSAEACAEHLSKGRQVGVNGRLVYNEWEAEDGGKRSKHSIVGRVEFLGSPNASSSSAEPEVSSGEDGADVPF